MKSIMKLFGKNFIVLVCVFAITLQCFLSATLLEQKTSDDFTQLSSTLFKRITAVKTNEKSVGPKVLDKIAASMVNETKNVTELEQTLLQFYALNSSDFENILIKIRKLNRLNQKENKQEASHLEKLEKNVQSACHELNLISMKRFNVPFHLAAVRSKFDFAPEVMKRNGISLEVIQGKEKKSNKIAKASCITGSYPRYVGSCGPWKLRISFNTTTRQRPEDVGCHYVHGPFAGTIRGWVSFSPQIWTMVALQSWGGKLAANYNHFFYKWWPLAILGLTPYDCHPRLYARVY
ncbi:MAG: hypothetical protein PVH61_23920 [Candidatus Aminicenantes bacterium]|jgi:hypothetical protein